MATVTTDHYRAYTPKPFTRAERDSTTILFGGLHWRIERIIQGVLEGSGYKARILPVATKEDLLTGREVADIGQCCPTSFTTGNLVNFLKKEAKTSSVEDVSKKFVYLTAGSCGACRFGQYHQSYELALRNAGLESFRMFLMAQDNMDQKAVMGDGLDLNLPITLGCLWAIFCTDLIQDLEYQVRPFEVVPGQTDAVVKESIDYLFDAFVKRPTFGPYKTVAWHLTTRYFTKALREIHKKFSTIEVDRLRVKPKVKITGEFYLQTVEGDPNYNIHRWLEQEGAQVYPAGVAVWMDYLLRLGLQRFEDYSGIEKVAGRISTQLCGGSTLDTIKMTIRQASDILSDGTNHAGVNCDAISIGIGFTGKKIGDLTKTAVDKAPPPDPCAADGGAGDGG